MPEKDLDAIKKEIVQTIITTVNGKIKAIDTKLDIHNQKHETDMARIMPVIEAFEGARNDGKRILWLAGIITALGGAFIVIRDIFFR